MSVTHAKDGARSDLSNCDRCIREVGAESDKCDLFDPADLEIDNRVLISWALLDDEHILARAAGHHVISLIARKNIATVSTTENVVATTAVQRIVCSASDQLVVPITGKRIVNSRWAVNHQAAPSECADRSGCQVDDAVRSDRCRIECVKPAIGNERGASAGPEGAEFVRVDVGIIEGGILAIEVEIPILHDSGRTIDVVVGDLQRPCTRNCFAPELNAVEGEVE